MPVPFVREVAHVRDGEIHASVFRALDECRKAVMVFPDVDELPMVFFADGAQVIQILCLKGFVIIPGVAARGKLVVKVLFEFFDFSHCIHPP